MLRHLPRFAARIGCQVAELEAIWREYRAHLRFVDAVPAFTPAVRYVEARDPNDVDFVHVQESFDIDVIVTSDKDLSDSPAPTIDPTNLLRTLSTYENAKRYKFALVVGGWTFAFSGSLGVKALAKTVTFVWAGFKRLPWYVQAGVAIVAAYGFSRLEKDQLRSTIATLRQGVEQLARAAVAHAQEAVEAETRAASALKSAQEMLPARTGRQRLMPALRGVLLERPGGVTEKELTDAVLARGYKTSARDLQRHISRILRREQQALFAEGRWRWAGS